MKWIYSETVKEHFQNPKNVLEDIDNYKADGLGQVGSPQCGDVMYLAIKINKEKNTIADCKWKTYGCASAIASTSVLSEIVIGMELEKAYNITPKDILKVLEGLPENKIHCSVLGDRALRKAIDDYYEKNNIVPETRNEENKIICSCFNITIGDIAHQIEKEKVSSFDELVEKTQIGSSCEECIDDAKIVFEEQLIAFEELR